MPHTFLFDKKLSKDNPKLEVLGTLDELSSFLGLASSFTKQKGLKKEIKSLQIKIFEMGEALFSQEESFKKKQVRFLEKKINKYQKNLPEQKKFILPQGTKTACLLHICRAITRRAERRLVSLSKKEKIDSCSLDYFNRLSSFLYILARFANFKKGKKEIFWMK